MNSRSCYRSLDSISLTIREWFFPLFLSSWCLNLTYLTIGRLITKWCINVIFFDAVLPEEIWILDGKVWSFTWLWSQTLQKLRKTKSTSFLGPQLYLWLAILIVVRLRKQFFSLFHIFIEWNILTLLHSVNSMQMPLYCISMITKALLFSLYLGFFNDISVVDRTHLYRCPFLIIMRWRRREMLCVYFLGVTCFWHCSPLFELLRSLVISIKSKVWV